MAALIFIPIVIIAYCIYIKFKQYNYKQPPGPLSLPFIGSFLQLAVSIGDNNSLANVLNSWSKYYGPIFQFYFGSYRIVVLNNSKHIRDAFQLSAFSARPELPIQNIRMGNDKGKRGLIFNDDSLRFQQRRFTIRHLRDFGFGKTSMEGIMLDEIHDIIASLKTQIGHPISTEHIFNVAVINTLWGIVAGKRFQSNDPKLAKLVSCVTQNLAETGATGALVFFPVISKMFPNLSGWNKYLESFQITRDFIRTSVQDRIKIRQPGDMKDFMDAYLEEIEKTKDSNSSFYGEEGMKNMLCVLDDLFTAGGETTSTVLTWIFLCLALNQEIQKKLHDEIDAVVGQDRLPALKDRPNMPFTGAIILEVLRVSSVVPLGVPHSVSEDIEFEGFMFQKGTIVFSNIYSTHNSEEWEEPQAFRPNRFLSTRNSQKINESFLPFSTGKRVCLGETLARDELFLFTSSVFQTFQVGVDLHSSTPTLQPNVKGLVAKTVPHKLIFNIRKQM